MKNVTLFEENDTKKQTTLKLNQIILKINTYNMEKEKYKNWFVVHQVLIWRSKFKSLEKFEYNKY